MAASIVVGNKAGNWLILLCQCITPLPFLTSSDCLSFDTLGLKHALPFSNGLRSLIKLTKSMWVLHLVRFSQLVPVSLSEGQCVVVLEFVILRGDVFRPGLLCLFRICESYLRLSAVRYTLDGNRTACLSQLANWRHLTSLESHSTCKLERTILPSERAHLIKALLTS